MMRNGQVMDAHATWGFKHYLIWEHGDTMEISVRKTWDII